MGIEGAGVVESVGWEVANDGEQPYGGLRVGDRVAFISNSVQQTGGTFCQYALLHADAVCKIPPASQDDYIDFVEAASIPFAAGAAYVALFDKLRVQPGRSIFISGASGGVGTVAVQMAKYAGLSVLASCSTHNMGYVQQLGADFVFDYTSTDPTEQCLEHTQGVGVDYVLELADAALAAQHGGALRFGGHMCVLSGPMPNETMNHNIFFNRQISLSYVSLTGLYSSDATRGVLRSVIQTALQLYQAGAFRLFLETAPLERATEALDIVATSHTRGKIVLTNFHPSEESADDKVVGTRRRTGAGASNETTNQRTCATGRHE
ncbi:putative Zinc binding dehydrogenase [Trypanosoma vivax]|nr:putative Zinc binding dehydrogenase [Trypanosoma vivax]